MKTSTIIILIFTIIFPVILYALTDDEIVDSVFETQLYDIQWEIVGENWNANTNSLGGTFMNNNNPQIYQSTGFRGVINETGVLSIIWRKNGDDVCDSFKININEKTYEYESTVDWTVSDYYLTNSVNHIEIFLFKSTCGSMTPSAAILSVQLKPTKVIYDVLHESNSIDYPYNTYLYANENVEITPQIIGLSPQSYSATDLPKGLKIDSTTGKLYGTPEEQGHYAMVLMLRMQDSSVYEQVIPINILPSPRGCLNINDDLPITFIAQPDNPWIYQTNVNVDGKITLQNHPQYDSKIALLVNGPGYLTYLAEIQTSEHRTPTKIPPVYGDSLCVYLDEFLEHCFNGENSWKEYIIKIPPGNHKVSWKYSKNTLGGTGAWIDRLNFTPFIFSNDTEIVTNLHNQSFLFTPNILGQIPEQFELFGALPAGLSFDTNSGQINGVTLEHGFSKVTIVAKSKGNYAYKDLKILVLKDTTQPTINWLGNDHTTAWNLLSTRIAEKPPKLGKPSKETILKIPSYDLIDNADYNVQLSYDLQTWITIDTFNSLENNQDWFIPHNDNTSQVYMRLTSKNNQYFLDVNTEVWPIDSAKMVKVVYTFTYPDRTTGQPMPAWSSCKVVYSENIGTQGNNSVWNCKLGPFLSGKTVQYFIEAIDSNGIKYYDNNGGNDYVITIP